MTAQPVHLNLMPSLPVFNLNATCKIVVTFTLYNIRSGAIVFCIDYPNYFIFLPRKEKKKQHRNYCICSETLGMTEEATGNVVFPSG